MAGFKGQAEYSIDDKGRVPVPAKMRRAMSPDAKEMFVATRGFEECVFLYPANRWEEIEASIRDLNTFQKEERNFVRTISMWADDLNMDSQGRIALPKALAEYGNLTSGRALIIGAFDKIEIWDPKTFEAHVSGQTESYEDLAERVMGAI